MIKNFIKRDTWMKKLLFTVGTFALMILSIGFLFKVMQYNGADILVATGLIVFTLVLVIAAIKLRTLLFYSGSMSYAFLILAWLFKLLSLPGADLLYMAGMLVLSLVTIPLAGFWLYKHA
jgi:hypothetical protein